MKDFHIILALTVILLAAACLIARLFGNRLDKSYERMATFFHSRSLFVADLENDEKKINLLRIATGLVSLYRLSHLYIDSAILDRSTAEHVALYGMMLLSLCITTGFFTPVACLLLMLFNLHFNYSLTTYTLGIDVQNMVLLLLILYPAGRFFSLDARSLQGGSLRNITIKIYQFFSGSRLAAPAISKFAALVSYTLLCLYSVLLHLYDPMWLSGEAAIHLMSSTYLSQQANFFSGLFANYPVAVILAKAGMMGMIAWHFLLLPCILIGGLWRKLVLWWLFIFLIFSTFVLQLSVLSYYEFILFAAWFWNSAFLEKTSASRIYVLFDDRCNLCDKTLRFLTTVDIFNVTQPLPLSKNLDYQNRLHVNQEDLYKDIYGWKGNPDNPVHGYDFYTLVTRNIFLLVPLYPIFLLGKWTGIGPLLYRVIADRRIRMFGSCQISFTDTRQEQTSTTLPAVQQSSIFFNGFSSLFFLMAIVFAVHLPGSPLDEKKHYFLDVAHVLSLAKINVFNENDLKMTNHYFTVVHVAKDTGAETLLPYTDVDGKRLQWHSSDRVYYGNSLKYRRKKNTESVNIFSDYDYSLAKEIFRLANKRLSLPPGVFRLDFYDNQDPVFQAETGTYQFSPPQRVKSLTFVERDKKYVPYTP